jgi:hypothetical protein
MGKFYAALFLTAIFSVGVIRADTWEVTSPRQGQTFAFGSERSRQWLMTGNHLAIVMHFTNDPYVDLISPRQYDDFIFDFPNVRLGKDGKTFFYHPSGAPPVPVAVRKPIFLGTEIRLLSSSYLVVRKLHGLVTLKLVISDSPGTPAEDD